MSRAAVELAFVGDVHLEQDDPALPEFLAFLERLGDTARVLVFMGDLFTLWLGIRALEQPHQRAVLEVLGRLRRRGIAIRYVEGNRDYHIGPCYAGRELDAASASGFAERCGGKSVFAVHGDLVNPRDRSYRLWRRLSRSRAAWALFRRLPARVQRDGSTALERRLRSTNARFRGTVPDAEVRAYAEGYLRAGHDAVVLGHFHVERQLGDAVFIVPEWKGSRRYLGAGASGALEFLDA